ncbi:hypothetical protein SHDE107825_00365 [Shewanella denitrificans]|jgi:hypothetical protein
MLIMRRKAHRPKNYSISGAVSYVQYESMLDSHCEFDLILRALSDPKLTETVIFTRLFT